MVDSQSLQLVGATARLRDMITERVTGALLEQGYEGLTPAVLNFLSALECGVNYGSEIARNLGVSRQMAAKMIRELCGLGYLEQAEGSGRRKQVLFTERGEHLIADARRHLVEIDTRLAERIDGDALKKLNTDLETVIGAMGEPD